ncbi:hypothetical protein C0L75_03295 [Clostridium perfringens]
MKIELLSKEKEEEILNQIKLFLNKEIESIEIDFLSPNKFLELLSSLEIEVEHEEFDYNGWDYDFWEYIKIGKDKCCISGSGYYGGIILSRGEE